MKIAFILIFALFSTGCINIYSNPEVIRKNEHAIKMNAESKTAIEHFHHKLSRVLRAVRYRKITIIPFFKIYSGAYTISENAMFNDQLRKCDINGDNEISEKEAKAYSQAGPEYSEKQILWKRRSDNE